MPIVKRRELDKYIKDLDDRYLKLKTIAQGEEPNPNIYEQYHNNPDQYREEFREVNEVDIKMAIDDFNTILKTLKNIKMLKAYKLGK